MEPQAYHGMKAFFIIICLSVGTIVWFILAFDITKETKRIMIGGGCEQRREVEKVAHRPKFNSKGAMIGVPIGLAVSLLYSVTAAWIIRLCEAIKCWAYCGQVEKWDDETRLFLAALWPLTLICCSVLYLFLGIIHRLF